MRAAHALLLTIAMASSLSAAGGPPVDIRTRAQGAERIVVATIVDVHASFERNSFGDQIIVSHAVLQLEETMKGPPADRLELDVEGGTVGDLTLRVSDMPSVRRGERAVFFINRGPAAAHVPHLRGLGILELDANDTVRNSSLTLQAIRTAVRGARR